MDNHWVGLISTNAQRFRARKLKDFDFRLSLAFGCKASSSDFFMVEVGPAS
jgi:hypothetical protein